MGQLSERQKQRRGITTEIVEEEVSGSTLFKPVAKPATTTSSSAPSIRKKPFLIGEDVLSPLLSKVSNIGGEQVDDADAIAEQQAAAAEQEEKDKQKKMLIYGGIGIGAIIVIYLVYKQVNK